MSGPLIPWGVDLFMMGGCNQLLYRFVTAMAMPSVKGYFRGQT